MGKKTNQSQPSPLQQSGIEMVDVRELMVDPRVQRAERPAWVQRQVQGFDPLGLGTLHVSRRRRESIDTTQNPLVRLPPGLYTIDGWGRTQLCLAAGYQQKVRAMVYENLTIEREAALFRLLNTKTNHRAVDDFRIALVEGNEEAVGIMAVLAEHELGVTGPVGCVSAVAALRSVYNGIRSGDVERGRIALSNTLEVLTRVWGTDPSTFTGAVVEGLGMVFLRYPNLDKYGLIERLSKVSGGATNLRSMANGYREMHRCSLANAVASVVVTRYNYGRKQRLAEWIPMRSDRMNFPDKKKHVAARGGNGATVAAA